MIYLSKNCVLAYIRVHISKLLLFRTWKVVIGCYNAIRNETLFGCIECDTHVPEHLREHFSEMCPIFKNTEISRDDIDEYMKAYAKENDIMKRPRRSLIGSMISQKILLATPLLKWYLEHGLEVKRVYK